MKSSSPNNDTRILLVGIILIVITLVFSFGIPKFSKDESETQNTPAENPLKHVNFIDPKEAHTLLGSGNIRILDFRSESDFYSEHIIDSINISPEKLEVYTQNTLLKENQNTVILLISYAQRSEILSGATVHLTSKLPNAKVFSLSGGFEAWKNGAYPTLRAGDPTNPVDQAKVEYIKPSEVLTFITANQDVVALDVREESEYKKDYLDVTKNIPLKKIESEKDSLPRGQSIVVFGSNALESFQAGVRLFDLGFFQVYTLDGGYDAILSSVSTTDTPPSQK